VSLQCAAAQTGKDSFFLANDPKLLDILERQGLQFALHTIPAVKDYRLGYTHSMGDFLDRMMVKSGNVNEACGTSPIATTLQQGSATVDFCSCMILLTLNFAAAGYGACCWQHSMTRCIYQSATCSQAGVGSQQRLQVS
jgi:hypothetical protein